MPLLLEQPTSLQLQVSRVTARELPLSLTEDWNRLAADMPLRRWEWLAPWWRHYRTANDQLCLLVVRDAQGKVHGLVPWYQTRTLVAGKTLRFLGDNEICTDYQTLLAAPEHSDAVVEAVADWLLGAGRAEWDTLDWRGMSAADPLLNHLTAQLHAAGSTSRQRPLEHSWRVEFPATWTDFLNGCLSRKRREKLKALDRKFVQTGRAKLRTLTQANELDDYLGILRRLHQCRRSHLGQAGCFADPTFEIYHRQVADQFLELDCLRLLYLELDGTPAAAMYCVLGEEGVYQYQSGMDVTRMSFQPGWLCQLLAMRQSLESGARFWDFLRGDEAYKASWGATPTVLVQQRIAAPRTSARWRQRLWDAQLNLRQLAKCILRRPVVAAGQNILDESDAAGVG